MYFKHTHPIHRSDAKFTGFANLILLVFCGQVACNHWHYYYQDDTLYLTVREEDELLIKNHIVRETKDMK